MYAKLVFPAGTTTGAVNRTIAKLLSDSNSGSASLASLSFITQASSELYAGVNSGWSMHSSTPLQTGSVVAADAKYILQGTTLSGAKAKYIGIHGNALWTNAVAYSTAGNTAATTVLCAVQDPGAATEYWGAGYNSTTSTYTAINGVFGDPTGQSAGTYNTEIFIWAEPRKVIVAGADRNGVGILMAHLEFDETQLTTWKSLPPIAMWQFSGQITTSSQSAANRGATHWTNNTGTYPYVQFPGSIWSTSANSKFRSLSFTFNSGSYYPNNTLQLDDGTANGLNSTNTNYGAASASNGVNSYLFPGSSGFSTNSTWWNTAQSKTYNSSGSPVITLLPITWQWFQSSVEFLNFSSLCNIYLAPGGLGSRGDTVTLQNGDVWQYFPIDSTVRAFMIKKI